MNFNDQLHEDLYNDFMMEFIKTCTYWDLFPSEIPSGQYEYYISDGMMRFVKAGGTWVDCFSEQGEHYKHKILITMEQE